MAAIISINRAPVLTLWAAVVAQRLGFRWDESLSLGKALAGLNAQSKGRRLGIFRPHEEKMKAAREHPRGCEGLGGEGRSRPAENPIARERIEVTSRRHVPQTTSLPC